MPGADYPPRRNSEHRRSVATPGYDRASRPDDWATVIIGLTGPMLVSQIVTLVPGARN